MRKNHSLLGVFTLVFALGVISLATSDSGQALFNRLFSPGSKKPLSSQQTARNKSPGKPRKNSGDQAQKLPPWANNPQVKALQKKYQTPILMASYQATLPDPIMDEAHNIGLAAQILAGRVVQPGEVFSQNESIGPYNETRGFKYGPMYAGNQIVPAMGGGVCKIASLLYNLVILSNQQIVERYPHTMTVPYVPPGQDATVTYGTCDFRFRNTSRGPILIWAEKVGDSLYMAFFGQEQPPQVTWHHQILDRTHFWTEEHNNPSLPPGTEKVVLPGQDGLVVHSWLTIKTADGKTTRRDLGIDSYQPCPRVIEHSVAK